MVARYTNGAQNEVVRLPRTVVACVLAAACAPGSATPPDEGPDQAPLIARLERSLQAGSSAEGGFRVLLAFDANVDLDLYVTDPLQEAVYFANTPSRSGGALALDVRCTSEVERLETVTFEAPVPGRYRIGVDFPTACAGEKAPVAFAVAVVSAGETVFVSGQIEPLQFLPIVTEFDVPVPAVRGQVPGRAAD